MLFKEKFTHLRKRDWTHYGTVVLSFVAFIAMFSHCLIGPLLLPFMATLLPASLSSHNLCWLITGMTSIISVSFGVLLAEKFYSQRERGSEEEEGIKSNKPIDDKRTLETTAANDARLHSSVKTTKKQSHQPPKKLQNEDRKTSQVRTKLKR